MDWWQIERGVVDALLAGQELIATSQALDDAPAAADAAEGLRRLDLHVRAGRTAAARAELERLAKLPHPAGHALGGPQRFLLRRDPALARRWLELFPEGRLEDESGVPERLLPGAPDAEVDAWLAARVAAAPDHDAWPRLRLRWRTSRGTADALLAALRAEVEAAPADAGRALRFIRLVTGAGPRLDLGWVGETCRPATAHAAFELGDALLRGCPRGAIPLLLRSLELPVTPADREALGQAMRMASAMPRPDDFDWTPWLRAWTEQALARAYLETGQARLAQPHVERATALAKDLDGFADYGLAGQVQAASGQRVVEGRLLREEAAREGSVEYWEERARYYGGRGELEQAITACERALELPPGPYPRCGLVFTLAGLLGRARGEAAAVELLRGELERATPGSAEAGRYVWHLLVERPAGTISAEDPLLARHLEAAAEWGHAEERLVWRLLEPRAGRAARVERLARLTRGAHPTRALRLGWSLTRVQEPAAALPFLEDAVARLEDGNERRHAAFELFGAHLDRGAWRDAERTWPAARAQLGPDELGDWAGRLAACAAKAGALDDAVRLWGARANLDLADLRGMDELVRLGAGPRLRTHYEALRARAPDSDAVRAALAALR